MDIMTLLGLSTLKMTLGYAHATNQKLRAVIDSLENGKMLTFIAPSVRTVGGVRKAFLSLTD